MFIACFDFQFMRIVFLAMVRAMRRGLFIFILWLNDDRSPSRHSEGDRGMGQPRIFERDEIISTQNC